MRKSVWMAQLERALSREGMTGAEKRTVMNFYEEMYQDKRDDGMSEEEIIKEFGFPEDVAQSVRESDDAAPFRQSKKHAEGRDFEAEAYEVHTAKSYNTAPEYEAPAYEAPPAYKAPEVKPRTVESKQSNSSAPLGVAQTVFCVLLDIVLYAMGVGLSIGGVAVIIASFFVIAFNAGAWLAIFGVGLVIFACGCLIFGSAIKVTKTIGGSQGGAR